MRNLLRSRSFLIFISVVFVALYLYGGYLTANSFDRYCITDLPEYKMTEGYKLISFGGVLAVKCESGSKHLSVRAYNSLYAFWPFIALPSVIVEVPCYFFFQGGIGRLKDVVSDMF
ncbi:MAG: hypothetical protein UW30_C0005G0029 [Candidatus Giovannonibacteria bacterium GW2011_GWA2_44_13b]|uniref:Uncharacterized protein n=2 Tax=Candidatus Giovannoniibacteriota TaxID=1752738 RepID=A0A0G1H4M8_9BACT|nr:MAG: hypothetical protein UW30_C0005G0029 [Candidatus Giovannonibacteria bacterium GW2011_GWA2_44_13b]OGF81535.1 MAG: hypothetical protein A2924_03405 [Candidatus Giovannonibacteria bacterium RIFCSPLOWO2_01_FULL_44_16]